MIELRGKLHGQVDGLEVEYIAAASADRRFSFSGSGLAFGDVRQAFANTPNQGSAKVARDGTFVLKLHGMPNAYYDHAGSVYMGPAVHLRYKSGGRVTHAVMKIEKHGVPYRTLNHPDIRTSPHFYAPHRPWIRSQEDILFKSAYPCHDFVPKNFWGNDA